MDSVPIRREPPRFRRVEVARVEEHGPRLSTVTVTGDELEGFDAGLPAASVRLLLPEPGTAEVVPPTWNGNEFLLADGSRPTIRTLTPMRFDPDTLELDVQVVLHGDGPLSRWAATATPGTPAAVSGTGRGYEIDPDATAYLLLGDESAIPAISTLLEAMPAHATVNAVIETAAADGEVELPAASNHDVRWSIAVPGEPPGARLVSTLQALDTEPGTKIWAAGEAAAMQRLRLIVKDRGLARSDVVIRGYWKVDRVAPSD